MKTTLTLAVITALMGSSVAFGQARSLKDTKRQTEVRERTTEEKAKEAKKISEVSGLLKSAQNESDRDAALSKSGVKLTSAELKFLEKAGYTAEKALEIAVKASERSQRTEDGSSALRFSSSNVILAIKSKNPEVLGLLKNYEAVSEMTGEAGYAANVAVGMTFREVVIGKKSADKAAEAAIEFTYKNKPDLIKEKTEEFKKNCLKG